MPKKNPKRTEIVLRCECGVIAGVLSGKTTCSQGHPMMPYWFTLQRYLTPEERERFGFQSS
jgi:hypothetical protein